MDSLLISERGIKGGRPRSGILDLTFAIFELNIGIFEYFIKTNRLEYRNGIEL